MLEIFQYDFMLRAFAAGFIIAVIAPVIGMYIVARRYSLMADTLAHVSLLGVAISAWLGTSPIITALTTTVVGAIGIERVRQRQRFSGESVLALFLTGSLALAVVILSLTKNLNANFFSFLFGSITTVRANDIIIMAVLGVVTLATVVRLYRPLFLLSLDEELATASGYRVGFLKLLLVIMAAVTVALSMRIVGTLLIGAMMVIPVLTATQFRRGFRQTMILAIVISLLAVLVGLFASFYLNLATGGTIVVATLVIFSITSFVFRKRG
jgi:zinc transport system permease protein